MATTLQCNACKELKPEDAFARDRRSKSGRQGQCRSCHSVSQRNSHVKRRAKITALKVAHGCERCGVRPEDPAKLHWDHIDPATKWDASGNYSPKTTRGAIPNWSWPRIEAEIAKCRVLCDSCHSKRTTDQIFGRDPYPVGRARETA